MNERGNFSSDELLSVSTSEADSLWLQPFREGKHVIFLSLLQGGAAKDNS